MKKINIPNIRSYIPMNKEKANQFFDDIKYTLDKNKNDIINIMLKNNTRKIKFEIELTPEDLPTLNILITKGIMFNNTKTIKKEIEKNENIK